ncbi:MAG: hypothetical protein PVH89_07030 [Gammaproteobacteria bacterium]|jgi:hypothetical protein
MPRIVLTAEVEDTGKWESEFRGHRDLFREMGHASVYEYAIGDNNEVAVCVDVSDAAAFLESLQSDENVSAMKNDGVKRDTVKVFVVDKSLPI